MSESDVAIVGSGIVATAISWVLAERGHSITIFEKGPEFPYPHQPQFRDQVLYLFPKRAAWTLPRDLKQVVLTGDYAETYLDLDGEMGMVVGGSATHWGGVSVRMRPVDFQTRSKLGFGSDWPLTYDELEPYYVRAERFMGVSGTDDDNPFAPPRSEPFPLPPFALSWDDEILAARLEEAGIHIHTTPQARAREAYDGRPGCMNFGACATCPVGARYSPNHHLQKMLEAKRLTIRANTSVRRVLIDEAGRARGLVVRENGSARDEEHGAKVVVVAGGAIESARLLLLTRDGRAPDGLGNGAGHVGRNLVFHHYYTNTLSYREPLYAGRLGPPTGQTHQFLDPPKRGRHGGIKVDFHSWSAGHDPWERTSGEEVLRDLEATKRSRQLGLHAESTPSEGKYVCLSDVRDRFGDPFARVHYDNSEFDLETHAFAREVFQKFVAGTKAEGGTFAEDPKWFSSGAHHMGTCRMASEARDGVVDPVGRVFGSPNLFVVGAANFVGASGGVHPTLTLLALALRSADALLETLSARPR